MCRQVSALLDAFGKTWKSDTWVRPYLAKYRGILVAAVALSVIAYIFAAALMFASGYMISLAATIPFTVLALHVASIFVRIFGIGKPVIQYFERLASHDWVLRMTSSLRLRMYETLEGLAAKMRDKRGLGSMLGLFADDIEHVQDLYLRTVFPMIIVSVMYVVVVIAMGVFSPAMGLALMLVLGITAFVMPLWSLAVNGARIMSAQAATSRMYDMLTDDVIGIGDWVLAGRRDGFVARETFLYEERHKADEAVKAFERRLGLAKQVLFAMLACGLFVWAAYAFGDSSAADGFITTGATLWLGDVTPHDSITYAANWIAAFVLCFFPLIEVFEPASSYVLGFAQHHKPVRDLNALAATPTETRVAQVMRSKPGDPFAIVLDNVTFGYSEGEPVLENASLAVAPGEKVAIMGRSGAGKSTLAKLVSGDLLPQSGTVSVKGKIGIIEQAPYVFAQSMRENLLLADPHATDEEIMSALDAIGLSNLLGRLPDGLDTKMAEGGITLSGGERHRLALARILLSDPDIVILDEPYLGLDPQTEEEVASVLFERFADKTLLLITHHNLGLDRFDRVVRVPLGTPNAEQPCS